MEACVHRQGSSWFIPGFLALCLWYMHFGCSEPLDCPVHTLPSQVKEIFSTKKHGFTLTAKSTQFLHSYWLLHFEAAPFVGTSLIQLWAWVPIAPHATELVLEFKDHRRGPQRILLGSFPIVFSLSQSEMGSLVEMYCLLAYWMEVVPSLLAEEKTPSTEVADAILRECSRTQVKRDAMVLFVSLYYIQPPLFHLPYMERPFIPNVEQLILGQKHHEEVHDQVSLQMDKLCHLQDRKVNLHRVAWGQCIVAPKTFSLPYCQGICLALNSELHHSNFECYKKEAPTCSWLFQSCGPTKVRLFSLMIQDDEHKMSVYHLNTSLVEKCGCS